MKKHFKNIIVRLLWLQVSRLRKRHEPIVIAVAGSIGKTGTKNAIATVLGKHLRVRWQDGNYNDIVSVPLIFFGQKMPSLFNPIGWIRVFVSSELQIQLSYPFQAVVLELGTDYPGNLDLFKQRIKVDYGVLTGITPEHMEHFTCLDQVAEEELVIADIAEVLLVNTDTVAKKYLKGIPEALTYGEGPQDCRITAKPLTKLLKRPVVFTLKDQQKYTLTSSFIGKQSLPALAGAVLLASKLELKTNEVQAGLEAVIPVPGRMQLLRGEKGSLLIDDTYNSSPDSAMAALASLYEVPAKKKIAVLGQMNELGDFSQQMHEEVGEFCDPKKIDTIVTIGNDANKYLAKAAQKRGCRVVRCPSPYHAADIIRPLITKGTVVLAKGSQNGVFAEEVIAQLLADRSDVGKLVRQSRYWKKIKQEQFGDA